jgi:hypothetical protein
MNGKTRLVVFLVFICIAVIIYTAPCYSETVGGSATQEAIHSVTGEDHFGQKAGFEKNEVPAWTGIIPELCSFSQNKGFHLDKNTLFGNAKTPEWFQRIQFGIQGGTYEKTGYYFETVQPLYQDTDKINTFFTAARYTTMGRDGVYNLGSGYRRLFFDKSVLLGVNSFWDATTLHNHFRIGLGGEAFINIVELRANGYFALSPRRQLAETAAWITYEKAVSGFDLEAGIPIPYMNWIKCYGGAYRWDYKQDKDKMGWQIRTEIKPLEFCTVNFYVYEDSKLDEAQFAVDGRISVPLELLSSRKGWQNIFPTYTSSTAYPKKIDHSNRTLNRVERQYRVEVEKYMVSKLNGAVIAIRRGN